PTGSARTRLPAEFERPARDLDFHPLPDRDGWAPEAGFVAGFPAARQGTDGAAWMAHCHGAAGARRHPLADRSIRAGPYAVTGHRPRRPDRNITLVGRVIGGMELLSAVPRGPEPLGMLEDPARHVPIRAITLASELPAEQREPIEVLRTDTATFDA